MPKINLIGSLNRILVLYFIYSFGICVPAQYNANEDLDGDGVINSLDIDDDNDGILDTAEGICNEYSEITSVDITNKLIYGEWSDGTSYVVSFPVGEEFVSNIGSITDNTACSFNNPAYFHGDRNNIDNFLIAIQSTTATTIRITFSRPVTNLILQNSGLERRKIEITGAGIASTTLLKSNSQTSLVNNVLKDIDTETVHNNVCGTEADASVAGSVLITGTYTTIDLLVTDNNTDITDGFSSQFVLCNANFDKDKDGIPNYLDLDSDGDGCPDVSEAKVADYLRSINQESLLINTPITNIGGSTAAKESQIFISNGEDIIGPNNGFHDKLELTTTGKYEGTYDLTTFYLNPNTQNCVCYEAAGTGTAIKTKVGISTLNRTKVTNEEEWPYTLNGGFIALDSKEKGLVVPRISSTSVITTPKEGMMIYDTSVNCLKIYDGITDTSKGDGTGWTCLTQRCTNN